MAAAWSRSSYARPCLPAGRPTTSRLGTRCSRWRHRQTRTRAEGGAEVRRPQPHVVRTVAPAVKGEDLARGLRVVQERQGDDETKGRAHGRASLTTRYAFFRFGLFHPPSSSSFFLTSSFAVSFSLASNWDSRTVQRRQLRTTRVYHTTERLRALHMLARSGRDVQVQCFRCGVY